MPPRTTSLPPLYTRSLHISVVRCPVNQLTSNSQLKQGLLRSLFFTCISVAVYFVDRISVHKT